MTDTADNTRPAPRWLHVWAVLATALAFVLLLFGQLVTSFKAGMADPVWPTEPWYVFGTASEQDKQRFQEDFGFFVEHSHRIVGYTLGGVMSVFALVLWWRDRSKARWVGLAGLVLMIAGYGELHRGLISQQESAKARQMELNAAKVPVVPLAVTLAGFALAARAGAVGVVRGDRGSGLRLLAAAGELAVMIQGLLGGTRVALNALAGTDLATFHGVFAQVVVGILVTLAVLTARPAPHSAPGRGPRWCAVVFAAVLFVQLIWGAMVRHQPEPLTQRLHFLTAFAATAAAVWVLRLLLADPAARSRVRLGCYVIGGLLVAQLYLGVEAWMDRFGAYTLPELVPVTREGATIRTLHALVGSTLLATAVGLAVRLRQRTTVRDHTGTEWQGEEGRTRGAEERATSPRVSVSPRPLVRHGGDAT